MTEEELQRYAQRRQKAEKILAREMRKLRKAKIRVKFYKAVLRNL